jgi:hypothetical protein
LGKDFTPAPGRTIVNTGSTAQKCRLLLMLMLLLTRCSGCIEHSLYYLLTAVITPNAVRAMIDLKQAQEH